MISNNAGRNTGTAPEISIEELRFAIKNAKRGKAVGGDSVPAEYLKCLIEESVGILLSLLNKMYKTGNIPADFELPPFIPIPKKVTPKRCTDYRTICIMSHTFKLLLSIMNRRLETKIDRFLNETQFGFRAQKGTRDAIALLKVTTQKAMDMN